MSLDQICNYAVKNLPLTESTANTGYFLLFLPSLFTMDAMAGGGLPWHSYRFYASLEPQQREMLSRSGSLAFGDLDLNQRTLLDSLLFSTEAVYGGVEPTKQDQSGMFGAIETTALVGAGSEIEPTELMPNGLGKGFLSWSSQRESVLFLPPGNSLLSNFCLGPGEYGMMKAASLSAGSGFDFSMPKTVKLGERLNLELIFHVGPSIGVHSMLQDVFLPKNAPETALDQLPADFQAEVDKATAMMKKLGAVGGASMHRRGQGIP